MGIVQKLLFLFFVGSLLGWGLEVIFRRYFSANNPERKWINPGFLVGPYLPLYGFSLCILYLLAGLEHLLPFASEIANKALLFAVMAACVTLLEYFVGLFCTNVLKVKLWDYSDLKGNIKGIICPLFSFFWALLSAAYYFLIHPNILDALDWLSRNLAFSFFIGFFFGVFTIDVAYSTRILVKIRQFAQENDIEVKFEELKEQIRQNKERRREKRRFILPMHSGTPMSEHLGEYLEKKVEEARERAARYAEAIEEYKEKVEKRGKKRDEK